MLSQRLSKWFPQLSINNTFVWVLIIGSVFNFTAIAHQSNFTGQASYLFGDTTRQASKLLFAFFAGGGLGALFYAVLSYLDKEQLQFELFLIFEITVGLLGGLSAIIILWSFGLIEYSDDFTYLFFAILSFIVGYEDAVLFFLAMKYSGLKEGTATALMIFISYGASALAGLIFIDVFRALGGAMATSLFLGLLDLVFVLIAVAVFWKSLKFPRLYTVITFACIIGLASTIADKTRIDFRLSQQLFDGQIVRQYNSAYGRIDITEEVIANETHHRLYIGGSLQFTSYDEAVYHELLIHPSVSLASSLALPGRRLRVLVLGGGDGLAANELRQFEQVAEITVVDIDPMMTGVVAMEWPINLLNQEVFSDPMVIVENVDAFNFVQSAPMNYYDVIIEDLVDPGHESVSKLYSYEMYQNVYRILKPSGVFVTQSTSPVFAPDAFWTISVTLEEVFGFDQNCTHVVPYSDNVPSFHEWGWNMASATCIHPEEITIDETITDILLNMTWTAAYNGFNRKDLAIRDQLREQHAVSTVSNRLVMYQYLEGINNIWDQWGE